MPAWSANSSPAFDSKSLENVVHYVRSPLHVFEDQQGRRGVSLSEQCPGCERLATLPPAYPEWLGDRSFLEVHRLRFPYVAGAMANGIATAQMVIAMANAGMLGFFGAAGLTVDRIKEGLDEIEAALGGTGRNWGTNLIHAPNEPDVEMATVELYLNRGVTRVSASAYMALNPMIVRYAYSGVTKRADGSIARKNFVFAKISRPEVARRFLAPAPKEMLDKLVANGHLTAEEASIGLTLPVAEDITVEADSGGHTDNQTLTALFPMILGLAAHLSEVHNYERPIRVGAAGGLGTPQAIAAAFSLGAAYVLTGSVNQSAVESGLHENGKQLLCQAGLADVVMAPAADMFELGVDVQVLKRGTMFGVRAKKLYELYTGFSRWTDIPEKERLRLEKTVFQRTFNDIWADTEAFFTKRDPAQVTRANKDPKHQMALVFRWYLGLSSRWAIAGEGTRKMDYQIWCGPAMGSFNDWVKGSFLEPASARTVEQIARNLLEGAAVVTRAQQLRSWGVPVPPAAFRFHPRPLS